MVASLDQVETISELIAALQAVRTASGSPSYAEVATRVGQLRAARGVPADYAAPSKSTVYEAFKPGRKRIDPTLIEDIVAVFEIDGENPRRWRDAALRLTASGPLYLPEIVTLRDTPKPERFIGRTDALNTVLEMSSEAGAVGIVGLPGIGKSSLAERAAQALSQRFDETFWISMRGHAGSTLPVDSGALARALLDRWECTFEAPRVMEEIRRRLPTRNVLIVLDDVVSASQIQPFLPESGDKSRVIVTSRRPLGLTHELTLQPLDHGESLEMLGISGEETGADALVDSCGGIPLALDIALRRLRELPGWSLDDHATAFTKQPDALDPVYQRISTSYDALPVVLRSALSKLAQLPGTQGDIEQAAWLLGNDAEAALRVLQRLAHTGLIRIHDGTVWTTHDLVRAFATSSAHKHTSPSELQESFRRYVDGLTAATAAAMISLDVLAAQREPWLSELGVERIDQPKAREWLTANIATVFTTAAKTIELSDLASAARFATLMYYLGLVSNDGEAALELQRKTRAIAEQQGNRWEQMRALMRESALLIFRLGRSEEAKLPLNWAEDLCLTMMDHPDALASIISIKNSQATAAALADDLAGAESAFRELLPYVRRSDDNRLEIVVSVNLIEVLVRSGKPQESAELGLSAIRRADELGYEREILAISLNLTDALIAIGDLQTATEVSDRGVELARKLRHDVQLAFLLTSRSILAMRQGTLDDARRELEHAKELARKARHTELNAFAAEAEARIVLASGDLPAAEGAALRAVEAGRASADSARLRTSEELLAEIRDRIAKRS